MTLNKPLITIISIAALSLLSAGSVLAQDATPDYARSQAVTGSASRATVLAEGAAFRASGDPSPWSSKFSNRTQRVAVSQPRDTVKAETLRALHNHEVVGAGEVFGLRPARPGQFASAGL